MISVVRGLDSVIVAALAQQNTGNLSTEKTAL